MTDQSLRSRRQVVLPPWLDALSARAARFPWWALIIAVGLVALFYSFLTSSLYRRTLAWVTDNPQFSTDQYANVIYDVRTTEGGTRRVQGTLTGRNGQNLIVTTQPEELLVLPFQDIATLTCAGSETPSPLGDCPPGSPVTVRRDSISGRLIFEDLGRYQIVTDYGLTLDVRKITVDNAAVTHDPEGCSADREGRNCSVRLPLLADVAANTYTGPIVERAPDQIVMQLRPEVTETVNEANIVRVIRSEAAQCALNNLAGCDQGIFLTVFAAIFSFALAVVLGLIFSLMRISSNPILYNASTVYVEVIRGIPLVVTLLVFGYVIPPWLSRDYPRLVPGLWQVILFVASLIIAHHVITRRDKLRTDPARILRPIALTVLGAAVLIAITGFFGVNSDIRGIPAALLGLAVCYGAYLAELFRAGIQSIGRGQMEAARSLGMTYFQAMRHVILPQAFRVVLPPLGNEFIAMLKDTSLLTVLALAEMTQRARIFAADTFLVVQPYFTIAALYLCMTLFLSFVVRTVERRLNAPR